MRIPADVLAPYSNDSGRLSESPKPRAVESLGGLRAELSDALPARQAQDPREVVDKTPEQLINRRDREDGHGSEERRQGDRRQQNAPRMLDTRALRCRRKAASPAAIDITI